MIRNIVVILMMLFTMGQSIAASAADHQRPEAKQRFQILVGDSIIVPTVEMYRVSVGNARAIQAVPVDPNELLLIGEATGYSRVHIWEKGRVRSIEVTVLANHLQRVLEEARAALAPDSRLTVEQRENKIVIDGYSVGSAERQRLTELAKKYSEVMLLTHESSAEAIAQVDLFFVEVKREKVEQLGIRWNPFMQGPSAALAVDRANPLSWTLGIATQLMSTLQLLHNEGDALVLARPSLTTKVGASARFVAGGELPIPVSSALGQGSVLFKEYGIRIEVTPTLVEREVLNLKLSAEISSINFEAQVKDIPGISKRRTESEIQIRSGETIVVAGLISDDVAKSFERLPGASELPGIGGLFRSKNFRDRNTELLLLVSPRLMPTTNRMGVIE